MFTRRTRRARANLSMWMAAEAAFGKSVLPSPNVISRDETPAHRALYHKKLRGRLLGSHSPLGPRFPRFVQDGTRKGDRARLLTRTPCVICSWLTLVNAYIHHASVLTRILTSQSPRMRALDVNAHRQLLE